MRPDDVERLVAAHQIGISFAALRTELQLPDRTLRRLLTGLVTAGVLRREGRGPSTRYHLGGPPTPGLAGEGIKISDEGRAVAAWVRRPLSERKPVGYNEAFLRGYDPLRTPYLGEDARKHLARIGQVSAETQPAGTFARQVFERLLIDLSWASSRLEGNTYSLLETENLIAKGEAAVGRDAREAQMILNHKRAIELLVQGAPDIDFDRRTLLGLHAALAENLIGRASDEGRLRRQEVGITGTTYFPLAVPQKIEELFDLLLEKARAISDPFEQAFFMLVHVPYLQPFVDVNKRTSRLAANIPLVRGNFRPLSFVDMPESTYVEATLGVYERQDVALLRDVFVWAYERSAVRYQVIRDALPAPDPVRLQYRAQIDELVRELVRSGAPPTATVTADTLTARGIAPETQARVRAVVQELLQGLNEGSATRLGLRPSEFANWIRAYPTVERSRE